MLRFIVGLLVVLWLLGFLIKIGGGLIHILLIVALVVFIYDMVTKNKKI